MVSAVLQDAEIICNDCLAKTDLRSIAWKGLLFTVSIELIQLLTNVTYIAGYGYRRVDINDILFNFLGTMIGYGLFRGVVWL
ncbi:MAG: VanZ family protein [Thermacetogeniaceae bacterium]|jgi:glycopeptide antibiotics resistance protein